MTREELRELADFQADNNKNECAVSFYFQPEPPQNRSHRREAIVAKDLVKQALKSEEAKNKNGFVHADLERVLELASSLRSGAQGKAVFACAARQFWKEYDLPPHLASTQIHLQSRFQLKPLATVLGAQSALCVAVVDRQRARFFDLRHDHLRERQAIVHMLSRNASSYGYNGYEGGHAERRVAEEALQHFKAISERLLVEVDKGLWERLVIGCQDANWPEFESQLHPYVKERVIGRFSHDVASVSNDEIRARAAGVLSQWIDQQGSSKVAHALELAKAKGRGVAGLKKVLQALEAGEVQTLFLGENYSSTAVECPHCGHLDAHLVATCAACGHGTRELADVCDAIIPIAIRRDIELFALKDHEALDRAGNIAALLRFRSDQTAGQSVLAS